MTTFLEKDSRFSIEGQFFSKKPGGRKTTKEEEKDKPLIQSHVLGTGVFLPSHLAKLQVILGSLNQKVNVHISNHYPELLISKKQFGRAFQELVFPLLDKPKKKIFVPITNYLCRITWNLESPSGLYNSVTAFDSQERIKLSQEWIQMATEEWKSCRWAFILHSTGQYLEYTFSVLETSQLRSVFSQYLHLLETKKFDGRALIEKMCFNLLDYLGRHPIDPFNMFMNCSPSSTLTQLMRPLSDLFDCDEGVPGRGLPDVSLDSMLRMLLRWKSLEGHEERIKHEMDLVLGNFTLNLEGTLVAVIAELMPKSHRDWFQSSTENICPLVFCRLASPFVSLSSKTLEVYVDAFEKNKVGVPLDSLYTFHKMDKHPIKFEKDHSPEYFSNTLYIFSLFQQLVSVIEEQVAIFVEENGVVLNLIKKKEIPNLPMIEKLYSNKLILSEVMQNEQLLDLFCENLSAPLIASQEKWLNSLPPCLVLPPHLNNALQEIENFLESVPSLLRKEINAIFCECCFSLSLYQRRLQSLLNGARKNEVCDWWLVHIEKKVDAFLSERGFDSGALTEDYLDNQPSDLDLVEKNQGILKETIRHQNSDFVEETVQEVYETLDQLMNEMKYVLDKKWIDMSLNIKYSDQNLDSLTRDLEYLEEVKAMDQKIREEKDKPSPPTKKLEMSNVVPIAGLVMARFHVLECECTSALEVWATPQRKSGVNLLLQKKSNPMYSTSMIGLLDLYGEPEQTENFVAPESLGLSFVEFFKTPKFVEEEEEKEEEKEVAVLYSSGAGARGYLESYKNRASRERSKTLSRLAEPDGSPPSNVAEEVWDSPVQTNNQSFGVRPNTSPTRKARVRPAGHRLSTYTDQPPLLGSSSLTALNSSTSSSPSETRNRARTRPKTPVDNKIHLTGGSPVLTVSSSEAFLSPLSIPASTPSPMSTPSPTASPSPPLCSPLSPPSLSPTLSPLSPPLPPLSPLSSLCPPSPPLHSSIFFTDSLPNSVPTLKLSQYPVFSLASAVTQKMYNIAIEIPTSELWAYSLSSKSEKSKNETPIMRQLCLLSDYLSLMCVAEIKNDGSLNDSIRFVVDFALSLKMMGNLEGMAAVIRSFTFDHTPLMKEDPFYQKIIALESLVKSKNNFQSYWSYCDSSWCTPICVPFVLPKLHQISQEIKRSPRNLPAKDIQEMIQSFFSFKTIDIACLPFFRPVPSQIMDLFEVSPNFLKGEVPVGTPPKKKYFVKKEEDQKGKRKSLRLLKDKPEKNKSKDRVSKNSAEIPSSEMKSQSEKTKRERRVSESKLET